LANAPTEPGQLASLPKGIVTIAVMAIIFGTGGMILNAAIAAVNYTGLTMNLAERQMQTPPDMVAVAWASGDLLLALLLVTAGIALFFRKRWALILAVGVASLQIASTLGVMGMQAYAISQNWHELEGSFRVGAVFGIATRVLGAVFPAFAIVVLLQRSSRTAMR
jgi:hypothetical protein